MKRVIVLSDGNHNDPVGILLVPDDQLDKLKQIEHDYTMENYLEDGDERWESLSDLLKEKYSKIKFVGFDGEIYI